jgi:CRP/FNR family cyclic AMP-dependent transcriptional regulator
MASETKLWHLENINILKGMPMAVMKDMADKLSMKKAEKSQYIYFPDEPSRSIFFLKEGRVKLGAHSEGGKELIKAVLGPGEIFGELAITGEDVRTDYAQALDDNVLICAMDLEQLRDLMAMHPKLGLKVTKLIGLRLRKTERRLHDLMFKDARQRVVGLLKEMAKESGTKIGDEIMVKHHFTHNDFANLTATSRQTVTTILNELKDANLIYMERKKFLIRDLTKLQ